MAYDTINDAATAAGDDEGAPSAEKGTPVDISIGDGVTMRLKEERGGRGAFAPGDVIAGRYVVERTLGEGGMGIVYQCIDRVGGVSVAVKCLPPEVSRNAEEMDDIRANYRLVADLHHQNIAGARTLELDESTGDYYLVMDLARGMSLKRWMKRNPQAAMEAKLSILRQVAAALDYAHARKVIHRDVKPENVMVDEEGGVKVLDFGLAAQIRSSQSRTSAAVTSRGGTPGYKSPEQWRGKPQREQSDVYSFGVMAYWMFAGALPFDGDDPAVLGHAVLTEPVEPIAGLPAHMNAALAKALAKEPDDRFANCGDFVAALEGNVLTRRHRDAESQGGRARSPSGPQSGGPRSVTAVKGILAAALLAALAGGAWWWAGGRTGTNGTTRTNMTESAQVPEVPSVPDVPSPATNAPSARPALAANPAAAELALAEQEDRTEAERKAKKEAESKAAAQKAEEFRRRDAAFALLKTRINIKRTDAKQKMEAIGAFREDADGLESRIASADKRWKSLSAFGEPKNLEEARQIFAAADEAEGQIALDLEWLKSNSAGRNDARALEKEIASMLSGDLATFKADRYASPTYDEGVATRQKGVDAFKKGDFAEAKNRLAEAKEKFIAAANESRAFMVKTTLGVAREYFKAEKWQECVTEADKVLGWDPDNAEANKLKSDAESRLVPTAKVVATIDGREVSGAKLNDGTKIHATPIIWKLEDGKEYGPYNVSYESDGKRYYGTFDAVTVDWRGSREFAVALKEYIGPKVGDVKTLTLPGGATMEMIYVAPGSFMMGSPGTEEDRDDDETQHQVTLTKGYWLGKYEVTQRQWKSVMGDNPSVFKGVDRPVENVSWEDCQKFIAKVDATVRRQFGGGARLPTEAEWEYACRAGTTTAYNWGNVLNGDRANCNGSYPCGTTVKGRYRQETADVGSYSPNALGFYDMHGNASEWCNDWYGVYGDVITDPVGPSSGDLHVLRGGAWNSYARGCRSAYRVWSNPGDRFNYYGFRLCCSAGPREDKTTSTKDVSSNSLKIVAAPAISSDSKMPQKPVQASSPSKIEGVAEGWGSMNSQPKAAPAPLTIERRPPQRTGPASNGVDGAAIAKEREAVCALRDVGKGKPFDAYVNLSLGSWIDPAIPNEKYFRIVLTSNAENPLPVVPKDVVFLLDASGSIMNDRLKACRKAVSKTLRQLNTGDRFNVIAFRDKFSYAFPNSAWQELTEKSLDEADEWLSNLTAHGQTDVFRALRGVLAMPREADRPMVALFITDGDATSGMTRSAEIISRFSELNGGLVSIYMYGVKDNINAYLMDMVARQSRGDWARHSGMRWTAASGIPPLVKKFERLVLTDIDVKFVGVSDVEAYPSLVANLTMDQPVEIYGKCPAEQKEIKFSMRGLNGAVAFENTFTLSFSSAEQLGLETRTAWAQRRMYTMIADYTRSPSEKAMKDIRSFAERYGIEIPYEKEIK